MADDLKEIEDMLTRCLSAAAIRARLEIAMGKTQRALFYESLFVAFMARNDTMGKAEFMESMSLCYDVANRIEQDLLKSAEMRERQNAPATRKVQ